MPKVLAASDVEAFRQRICDAAARQYARHGYAGVTMRELARALDVSAMTPYRYFHDRDEILASVRAAAFARFADALEGAFAVRGDALAHSRAIGRTYLDFALGDPDAYRLMFDLTQPDESNYPQLQMQSARARGMLGKQVDELIAAGLVRGDRQALQHTLWAAIHGVIMLHLAGKYDREECIAAYRQSMQFLFSGFALSARSNRKRRKS